MNDVIDETGAGMLYRARHAVTEAKVAVHVLHASAVEDADVAKKLAAGARAARAVHHANLADVIDVGSAPGGTVFVVTESLEGETLRARLNRVARLPLFEAINLVRQMAHGLGAAHEAGLVHGGLNPSNIFLCTRKGRRRIVRYSPATPTDLAVEPEDYFDLVKLLDLGLAGLGDAAKTAARGTPDYGSPEQAAGRPAERSSDIYALGAIFYEMITGTAPFLCDSPRDMLGKGRAGVVTLASRRAPGAGIHGQIDDMILKCLKRTPRLRFANTTELCESLDACVTDCAFLRDARPMRPMQTPRKTPPPVPPHARRGGAKAAKKLPMVPTTTKSTRSQGTANPLPPPIPRTHAKARGKAQPPPIPKAWKAPPAKMPSIPKTENPAVRAAVLQRIAKPDRFIPLPMIADPSHGVRITPPPIPLTSDLLIEITDPV